MYLNEPTLNDIAKKQFRFKLNANAASFSTFVLLQVGAIILAILGNSHGFLYSSDDSTVSIVTLANDTNMVIAMIWAFVLGIMLTTRIKQSESFSFVSTRLSNHLSNFLFMLFASLIAGVSAALSSSAIKLFGYLVHGEMVVYSSSIVENPNNLLLQLITAISYILLLFLIGYLIGSLVQANKLFIAFFAVAWIFFTSMNDYWNGTEYALAIIQFFGSERSALLFILKISGTVLGLFTLSTLITNRLEVRNQ
ncbi:hypothetical protein JSQ81_14805 [Sporosarcina sp. Marseille-Q4063]|uniref:hypothetical protein n=1 Tax=Sporosarcina sp. Marseille-Q4063 TaxID=2810514 RepID=UPI001BB0AFDE|nr:hypothetical protein [Sporosarcina sp. Marseille-Q4063]QUW21072.1 hypothetical protein JSQ81_14805 [Sporosarcina sp. Marseille-Q4063]